MGFVVLSNVAAGSTYNCTNFVFLREFGKFQNYYDNTYIDLSNFLARFAQSNSKLVIEWLKIFFFISDRFQCCLN